MDVVADLAAVRIEPRMFKGELLRSDQASYIDASSARSTIGSNAASMIIEFLLKDQQYGIAALA